MLAWRRFLLAHALVTRRLETDLVAERQLPLASYDVLVQLVEARSAGCGCPSWPSGCCSRAAG